MGENQTVRHTLNGEAVLAKAVTAISFSDEISSSEIFQPHLHAK